MRTTTQKIFEFYEQALQEIGIYEKVYQSGDLENIFEESFKETWGDWPDDDDDDDDDDD